MATTDFSTGTVIEADWLNDVDEAVYTTLPTKAALAGSASQSFSMLNATVAGNVGIGTSTPLKKLDIAGGGMAFTDPGGASRSIHWGDTTNIYPVLISANATSGNCYLTFGTATFGDGAVERMRIDSAGAVTIPGTLSLTGTASTLGYGTGAGGTVTQATSKSTTVTLNKPCGQITMNNAALAAGATATFVLNNTLLTTEQNIFFTEVNVTGSRRYSLDWNIGNGYAYVHVTNETAGSLSDAVVINFAIVKGAVS